MLSEYFNLFTECLQRVLREYSRNISNISLNLFRHSCGKRANKCVLDWLKEGAEPNILITDFVLEDSTSKEILDMLLDKNMG